MNQLLTKKEKRKRKKKDTTWIRLNKPINNILYKYNVFISINQWINVSFFSSSRKYSADLKTEGNSLAFRAMACLNMQNTLTRL